MENKIWQFLEPVEKMLHKYDIDSTACTQRVICTLVKESAENVSKGIGSSTDKIFDGLSR